MGHGRGCRLGYAPWSSRSGTKLPVSLPSASPLPCWGRCRAPIWPRIRHPCEGQPDFLPPIRSTVATVERLFSAIGVSVAKKRRRSKAETLADLAFAKMNIELSQAALRILLLLLAITTIRSLGDTRVVHMNNVNNSSGFNT